jgi:hypothetical protein
MRPPTIAARGTAAVVIALLAACSGSSGTSWTPVPGFPDAGGSTLGGVAAGSASFVAVGQAPASGETNHAAVWTSADGKAWTRVADDPSFSMRLMNGVAAGPSGWMAVGGSCGNGECFDESVWTSADGQTWHPAALLPVEARYYGVSHVVVAGGPGWIVGGWLVGGDPNDRRPGIWTTADGSSWIEATVTLPSDGSLHGSLSGLAVGSGTDVAVGLVQSDTSRSAAVWTSTDGKTWSPAAADASFSGALMNSVAAGGPGFVAVGKDDNGAAVWSSTDGASWKEEPAVPGAAGAQMLAVSASGGRFVAVGYDSNTALVWTSKDGLTWTQSSTASDMAGAQALSAAVGSSTDVVVGASSNSAKAWTASH